MIKGVTKNIIEIKPHNHDYYERLIIILKDIPDIPSEDELHQCAMLLIGKKPPSSVRKIQYSFFKYFLSGLIGSIISLFACWITLLFV